MVKKQALQLFVVLALLLAGLFLWQNYSRAAWQQQQAQASLFELSELNAQIDSLLSPHTETNQQALATALQRLGQLPQDYGWELLYWALKTQQGEELGHLGSKASNREVFIKRVDVKVVGDRVVELEIGLVRSQSQHPVNSRLSLKDGFMIAGLLGVIFIWIFWRFKWLFELEDYTHYLLANSDIQKRQQLSGLPNPMSQLINQLILSNSLLSKTKIELTEKIRKTSYIDEVTGLGNHLFFKAELEVRLSSHEESESGLVMILGVEAAEYQGQSLLDPARVNAIAAILRGFIQERPNSLIARLKENEFALILPNQTSATTDQLCEMLIKQLENGVFDNSRLGQSAFSIGISAYKKGFDYSKILSEADMALRNAQLSGENTWFMYGEALAASKVRGSLMWRSFLEGVLDKRQVKLFGMNSFPVRTEQCHDLEIFIRVQDGDQILAAETFLPMAYQCGLATEFDRQVVDSVIKYCIYAKNNAPLRTYTVNLFIHSLLDERFVTWLMTKLSSYPQVCKQIFFAVKEQDVNKHLTPLSQVMTRISELGMRFCVKRFGSPEENLNYLELLPISRVKIDRRLIHNIHKNPAQQLLLGSLILHLKSKSIEVFADGVEKAEDADYLSRFEIDAAQGYYYMTPTRLSDIESQWRDPMKG